MGGRAWTWRRTVPVTAVAVGLVLAVLGLAALGVLVAGLALVIVVADWWIRLAIRSQGDRDAEAERRAAYLRTGSWDAAAREDEPPDPAPTPVVARRRRAPRPGPPGTRPSRTRSGRRRPPPRRRG